MNKIKEDTELVESAKIILAIAYGNGALSKAEAMGVASMLTRTQDDDMAIEVMQKYRLDAEVFELDGVDCD